MTKTYKMCQSCGMPFSKDPKGGGTNADGSTSRVYCSHCFVKGKFAQPDMTLSQMQDLVRGKLKEMRVPGFLAWFFVRSIPRLGRWTGKT